ncbi:S1 family peptidase [Streptomyces sp. NPDC004726]
MSHRRIPKRKAILAGAGAVGIAVAAVLLPQAYASQEGSDPEIRPKRLNAASAAELVKRIGPRLGEAYGGGYYDAGKQQLVVNVVGSDDRVMDQVQKAGAVPKRVRNSVGRLRAAKSTLSRQATIPGTSWAVDPKNNQVLVTADRTVAGGKWDRLEAAVKALGPGVARIQKSAGEFKPFLEGGDAIFGGGGRCSVGFNVTAQDGSPGFLTAGHCGVVADRWSESQNGQPVGTVREAVFPGAGDFALVAYDDPATQAASEVDLGQGDRIAINAVADAAVGQQVFRMGSTTGLRDGQVTGLDATVNYPEGTVTGLIQTNVCAEPGDSGGSLFTRDGNAIGLTSGGSGDCTSGGETFFQPVTTALEAVGAQIGGGGGGAGDGGGGDNANGGGNADGGADANGGADADGGAGGGDEAGAYGGVSGGDRTGGDQGNGRGSGGSGNSGDGDGGDQDN